MHLVVVGLNHHSAPIAVREQVAVSEAGAPEMLRAICELPGVSEAAILSTCNRTELYAALESDTASADLARLLSERRRTQDPDLAPYLYTRAGADAVVHLCRVSCGLDSLVIGEPQILGQVRQSFAASTTAGAAGPLLNALFRCAIGAGKRARAETGIGRGGFSIGHAAVDLARSIFGSLEHATILILGAGKMSELTARHLVSGGARVVLVANRTFERARELASRLGGRAIQYDAFPDELAAADVLISSTASPTPVVHREMLQPALRRRRGRPLFLIDIAVPRDISPDVAEIESVFLYDVDDLQAVVADMARERAAEIESVETIIAEECASFLEWLRARKAAPVVAEIRAKHEQIRLSELARLKNQLPDLSEAAWDRVERATRSMVNRMTRDAVSRLRAAATDDGEGRAGNLVSAARELFGVKNLEGVETEIGDQSPAREEEAFP